MSHGHGVYVLIFGLLAGYTICDLVKALPSLHKPRTNRTRSWLNVVDLLVPKWMIIGLILLGLVLTGIGTAQVYQSKTFHDYQECQAARDQAYDLAQRQRTAASLDLTRKRFAYDSTVVALLTPGNGARDRDATKAALNKYIKAADDYFKTVDKNPYPESSIQLCGTPKG